MKQLHPKATNKNARKAESQAFEDIDLMPP